MPALPVPRPDLDDAATMRELELSDLPGRLRGVLLLQNGLAPYVWYAMLAARPNSSPAHLFLAWIGLWLCTAVATGLGVRRWPFHLASPIALALSVAASLAWVRDANNADSVWLFPLLVAATLYRVRRFIRHAHLHDENRLAFGVDCVLIVVGLLGCAAAAGTEGLAFAFAAANGLVAILSRLYSLWQLERISHGSEGASKATWGWMASFLILLALLGLLFGPYLVYGILLLYGLLMSPFAWLIPRNLHLQGLPNQQENNSTDNVLYTNDDLARQHVSDWVGAALLIAVAGVGLFLLMRRLGHRGAKQAPVKEEVETSRRWIGRSDDLRLLPTDDAVRLELQKWIREQHAKGNTIKPHETANAFLQRTAQPEASPGTIGLQADFAHRYNQVRYLDETTEGR